MAKRKPEGYINDKPLHPESLMMGYGYRPDWSEGAIKCPIFQTATFAFESAEEGKAFFELALGMRERGPGEELGLIYSRLNNPDLEILEDRMTLWDDAEAAAVFESGMAAITTTIFAYCKPGDLLLHSEPLYGGTDYLLKHVTAGMGIEHVGFMAGKGPREIEKVLEASGKADRLAMIFVETPSNPTNALVDIQACADLAKRHSKGGRRVVTVVDNTFLGPIWQHPLDYGADLVIYSATKYIGGHSDVVAGVCVGPAEFMKPVKGMRSFIGTTAGPWTAWLLLRSLETLKLRMTCQNKNARYVADFLADHPKVERVSYLGHLTEDHPDFQLYRKQCLGPGGMVAFDIVGGEAEAFRFLNGLKMIHIAVSLGGTESLAEHPATMTHSDVDAEEREAMGITDKMVRLSIGVENPEDLILDLDQALTQV